MWLSTYPVIRRLLGPNESSPPGCAVVTNREGFRSVPLARAGGVTRPMANTMVKTARCRRNVSDRITNRPWREAAWDRRPVWFLFEEERHSGAPGTYRKSRAGPAAFPRR